MSSSSSSAPPKLQYKKSALVANSNSAALSPAARVALSKKLSKVLRHDAHKHKLRIDDEGYIRLTELLASAPFRGGRHTIDQIKEIVADCKKQRFALRTDDSGAYFIRANQGHTFAVDEEKLLLRMRSPPPFVIHGTYLDPLPAIRTQGLSRMKRTHIHLAPGFDAVSGIRASCTVAIVVDVKRAIADGVKFFVSANGVILTPGNADGFLEPKYFTAILDAKTRRPLDNAEAPEFDIEAHGAMQIQQPIVTDDNAAAANDDDDVETAEAERSKKPKKGSM